MCLSEKLVQKASMASLLEVLLLCGLELPSNTLRAPVQGLGATFLETASNSRSAPTELGEAGRQQSARWNASSEALAWWACCLATLT